jgi:hypothetical protein
MADNIDNAVQLSLRQCLTLRFTSFAGETGDQENEKSEVRDWPGATGERHQPDAGKRGERNRLKTKCETKDILKESGNSWMPESPGRAQSHLIEFIEKPGTSHEKDNPVEHCCYSRFRRHRRRVLVDVAAAGHYVQR